MLHRSPITEHLQACSYGNWASVSPCADLLVTFTNLDLGNISLLVEVPEAVEMCAEAFQSDPTHDYLIQAPVGGVRTIGEAVTARF